MTFEYEQNITYILVFSRDITEFCLLYEDMLKANKIRSFTTKVVIGLFMLSIVCE